MSSEPRLGKTVKFTEAGWQHIQELADVELEGNASAMVRRLVAEAVQARASRKVHEESARRALRSGRHV